VRSKWLVRSRESGIVGLWICCGQAVESGEMLWMSSTDASAPRLISVSKRHISVKYPD